MVLKFVDWCAEKGLELPELNEQPPQTQDVVDEKAQRTGCKEPLYPPQYFAGQYPGLYKTPIAADSAYYQSIKK